MKIVKCTVCKKHAQVTFNFMTTCHECTKVRELRSNYQVISVNNVEITKKVKLSDLHTFQTSKCQTLVLG